MLVKVYENQYGDRVVNVNNVYIIYDKIDRGDINCNPYSDKIIQACLSNGFKEVSADSLKSLRYE